MTNKFKSRYDSIASALSAADWENVSIGNKAIILAAIDALGTASRMQTVAINAAAAIDAIYQWVERVEKAGGATSMSGVASCHAMLTSLRKNAARTETLIIAPIKAALTTKGRKP